jgi:hypothetical protein
MLKAAKDFISDRNKKTTLRWDPLILVALQEGRTSKRQFSRIFRKVGIKKKGKFHNTPGLELIFLLESPFYGVPKYSEQCEQ